jgi:ornithine cyclodeaminase/alanine dehydrogenase-like protein (mu-crystallin family)
MNTVMRTLGGALGGQLSATFIAENTLHDLPTVTGFTETFLMATGFLLLCFVAGLLVPKARAAIAAPSGPGAPATGGAGA